MKISCTYGEEKLQIDFDIKILDSNYYLYTDRKSFEGYMQYLNTMKDRNFMKALEENEKTIEDVIKERKFEFKSAGVSILVDISEYYREAMFDSDFEAEN